MFSMKICNVLKVTLLVVSFSKVSLILYCRKLLRKCRYTIRFFENWHLYKNSYACRSSEPISSWMKKKWFFFAIVSKTRQQLLSAKTVISLYNTLYNIYIVVYLVFWAHTKFNPGEKFLKAKLNKDFLHFNPFYHFCYDFSKWVIKPKIRPETWVLSTQFSGTWSITSTPFYQFPAFNNT